MQHDLRLILDYLEEQRGFDFSGYRTPMLERRIRKRLSATENKHLTGYLSYLREHPDLNIWPRMRLHVRVTWIAP